VNHVASEVRTYHNRGQNVTTEGVMVLYTYCPIICRQLMSDAARSSCGRWLSPAHLASMPLSARCNLCIHGPTCSQSSDWLFFFDCFSLHTHNEVCTP